MATRKDFIKTSALLGTAPLFSFLPSGKDDPAKVTAPATVNDQGSAHRLVISISMQFEAGGEPASGFDSPFPANLEKGYMDLPAKTWFQYGYKEGIPRLLDLWDKHQVKVTSHIIGAAATRNPALAKEIVARGHEAAAHGLNWTPQYTMTYEQEKAFIKAGVDAVREATGVTAVGYNANWLRRSPNTLSILQELGFLYHIDDLSRDEPFLIPLNGKKFAVVPYTLRNNDIQLLEGRYFSSAQFGEQLKLEFDQLYAESAGRKRQMSISTHDRISGTPAQVRVLDEFITYAKKHPGSVFMRKDEIAKATLLDPSALVDNDYK